MFGNEKELAAKKQQQQNKQTNKNAFFPHTRDLFGQPGNETNTFPPSFTTFSL